MTSHGDRWRLAALLGPTLVLVLLHIAPLVTGARTLIIRDVLNTHATLRLPLADALRAGEMPLIDPLRSGGQPLAGNANVLAFYPDNVLLLIGSNVWQLNVHFALHWLLAFASAWWLGRAWGLGPVGSAGGAVVYALSGFWLSQMNFYNAVAPVALAPALWAALLRSGEPDGRRHGLATVALIWTLMVLGGDPIVAVIALAGGLIVALARHGRRLPAGRLLIAFGLGCLVAAPQIVETLRILPFSYRTVQGYADAGGGMRDPRALIDLLVPLFFGRPDLGAVWGKALFGGHPPIYFSLAPGLLALAFALAAGRPQRREARWLAGLATVAFALTFSGGLPLIGWLAKLPGGGLLRFPEKAFLIVSLALLLASGRGLERFVAGEASRRIAAGLLGFLLLIGSLWALFGVSALGGERLFLRVFGEFEAGAGVWREQHLRWAGLSMFLVAAIVLSSVVLLALRRHRFAAAALLIALHAGSQLAFLGPLLATDDAHLYRSRPPVAAEVPRDAVLAQGGVTQIFGADDMSELAGRFPDLHLRWLQRNAWSEFHAFAVLSDGRRLELDVSPEGLDAYVGALIASGMKNLDDTRRIGILRATGVDLLLLVRDLMPADAGGARLTRTFPGLARTIRFYEIPAPLPEVTLAGSILRAPHMNAALEAIWRPGFDPATTAVIPGSGPPVVAPPGSARLVLSERERAEVEIDSPAGGVLILRRAHLPIWQATIDGEPAPTVIAQLTRLAVEVPPGPHRVVFSISRWPLRISSAVSLLALITLVLLWRRDARQAAGRQDAA